MINTYVKKPVKVEAIQYIDECEVVHEIMEFLGQGFLHVSYRHLEPRLYLNGEETVYAVPGDYIIKGVNGEFYPCPADVFMKTYDKVYS